MNSIQALFAKLKTEGRSAFIPFLPAGDPDLAFTGALLPKVAEAGADLIEVGFPFSDPIADGPVIQESYTRALAKHIKVDDIFGMLKAVDCPAPRMAMASYSLIWRYGPERFIAASLAAGVTGAVVPDLPVEEAEAFGKLAAARDFALTLLVTPTTSPARAEKIMKACTGFVYVVSVVGITGNQSAAVETIAALTARLRNLTDKPLCLGFGINTPEQVAAFAPYADGIIVGSAIVKKLTAPDAAEAIPKFIRELRSGMKLHRDM